MKTGAGKGGESAGAGDVLHQLNDPDMTRRMNDAAAFLKGLLPPGYGFTLLAYTYGEGGNLFYISSAEREDSHKLIAEYLRKRGGRK